MLAIRKDRQKKNDNYRALALYICGYTEKNPEEKILASWFSNCDGEDFAETMMEVEAVQNLNTTEAIKTYHLILSFRPEDEARLTPEIMADIDARFAEALGYAEHQRCCGIHKNTNNMHMHIAYNMINPEKFNRHEPFRDFYALAETCREVEALYGLAVDAGLEPERKEPTRPNIKAQAMEAHSGQESFDGYVQRHREELLKRLGVANDWQGVHKAFAAYGIGIKPGKGRAGGLVLHDLHGRSHLTASSLSRATAGAAMQKRFGAYAAPERKKYENEIERYSKSPLQAEPNRANLYEGFLAAKDEKQRAWDEWNKHKDAAQKRRAEISEKWNLRRKEIQENKKLLPRDRWALIQDIYLKRKTDLASDEQLVIMKKELDQQKQDIRAKYPFSSWTDYLKLKTLEGNEDALDVLRSKKLTGADLDKAVAAQSAPGPSISRLDFTADKKAILANTAMLTKDKKALMAILTAKEKTQIDAKLTISPSGVLILSLPTGGTVRDSGKQLYFSKFDPQARKMAEELAKLKWGKMCRVEENSFVFDRSRSLSRSQSKGMGR
ncbi:MAG: relaxase/mobilization nuclease domain-containing protein [Deltaproteobacteria bacterium]|jgi:hypothetical protein|nr:relaxase/mobilization nuclease domain-containing protein [Deltaproteobacteria bacterium]